MSDDGTVLLSSGDKIPVSDIRDNVETLQESDYKTIRDSSSGGKHLVIANKTDRANILFIEVFNEKMLLKKLNIFQVTILLIPVGLVITLIIYFIFIQHIVLNPMNELEKGINRINESNLDFKLEEKGAVEFKLIIKVFNNMVTQIHDLKIDIYEERLNLKNKELEKKKSELINLQLRINPHFFANSLNIIYNLAALEKYKTVQDMAILLSRYFRYMIQTKQVLTELKNEIDFVKDYLEIQKLRFTKRLEYSIDVDKQLLSLMLPSLLIQPFVENSIVHGFPAKEDVMYIIIITAKLAYDGHKKYINIRITDNGKGFSKKDIANFSNPEYFTDINERHIGISNVYNRLKIIYGQSAGILLHNNENGGAEVNISIPAGS
jgi:two-component system sensor histidine kinase YesM